MLDSTSCNERDSALFCKVGKERFRGFSRNDSRRLQKMFKEALGGFPSRLATAGGTDPRVMVSEEELGLSTWTLGSRWKLTEDSFLESLICFFSP